MIICFASAKDELSIAIREDKLILSSSADLIDSPVYPIGTALSLIIEVSGQNT